jgi:hypothetical protein
LLKMAHLKNIYNVTNRSCAEEKELGKITAEV